MLSRDLFLNKNFQYSVVLIVLYGCHSCWVRINFFTFEMAVAQVINIVGIDFSPDLPSNFKSGKVALVDDNRFGKNIPAHRYLW